MFWIRIAASIMHKNKNASSSVLSNLLQQISFDLHVGDTFTEYQFQSVKRMETSESIQLQIQTDLASTIGVLQERGVLLATKLASLPCPSSMLLH